MKGKDMSTERLSHTPGNWSIVRTISGKQEWYLKGEHCFLEGHYIVEGPLIGLARVSGETQEEALANARLIAAAPKLLCACQEMLNEIRAYNGESETEDGSPVKDWCDMLKAAIAKATNP